MRLLRLICPRYTEGMSVTLVVEEIACLLPAVSIDCLPALATKGFSPKEELSRRNSKLPVCPTPRNIPVCRPLRAATPSEPVNPRGLFRVRIFWPGAFLWSPFEQSPPAVTLVVEFSQPLVPPFTRPGIRRLQGLLGGFALRPWLWSPLFETLNQGLHSHLTLNHFLIGAPVVVQFSSGLFTLLTTISQLLSIQPAPIFVLNDRLRRHGPPCAP